MNTDQVTTKVNEATDKAAGAVKSVADSTLKSAGNAVNATRNATNNQLDKAANAVDALRDGVEPTVNDLAAKAQALAERSINYCADKGERIRQQVDLYSDATTRYVVDQPAKSMMIAFGSGAALATLLILAMRGGNRD